MSSHDKVALTLFKSILRSAKSLAKDESGSIRDCLRNGTARVTGESIGASDFQSGIQRLERCGILSAAIKQNFRAPPQPQLTTEFGLLDHNHEHAPSSSSHHLEEGNQIDRAFHVLRRLNAIDGALQDLKSSGAFEPLTRRIGDDAADDLAAAEDYHFATVSTDDAGGAVANPMPQQQQQQPAYSVGEFVHHWCHGPGLVFGWERSRGDVQTMCGGCADRLGE